MCGVFSAELPHLTACTFENALASDDVLAHFFNDFLSLLSFSHALQYNQETGLFEVVSEAADFVSRRIKIFLYRSRSQLLAGDPTTLARTPTLDNHYTVCCLDREQGIQWIVKERLPFFLQSDCYNEYRLAKLLFQGDPNLCPRKTGRSSQALTGQPCFFSRVEKENNALTCSQVPEPEPLRKHSLTSPTSDQKDHNTKRSESSTSLSSCFEPDNQCAISSPSYSAPWLQSEKTPELNTLQLELSPCFTAPSAGHSEEQHLEESSGNCYESSELQLEEVAAKVVQQVLNSALNVMGIHIHSQANSSDCFNKSAERTDCSSTQASCESKVSADSGIERLEGEKKKVQEGQRGSGEEEKTECFNRSRGAGSRGTDRQTVFDTCCHGACCRGLDEFREFLRGTPGEKLLNLWMDVERLKATQNKERKYRHLVLMRSWYLLSSSHSSLSVELLARLGLTTSPCWTQDKLTSVQPSLTEPLLSYWAPRFWTSQWVHADSEGFAPIGLRMERCASAPRPHHSSMTPSTVRPDTCLPNSPHAAHTQLFWNRSQLPGGRTMEKLLQALCVDACAGSYFTNFCEQSGNQLWESAVHFWSDLQHYRELFYQDGLDLYRVQREAQLLYSTYLYSPARRRLLGVDEEIRRQVYERLSPPFEELFDRVEEHALDLLLEPWTLLVCRDQESFQKVCVQEEARCVDSEEYRELRSLYEESERCLKRVEQRGSTLSSRPGTPSSGLLTSPRASASWSRVPPGYQGYRLGSLLRHRHEVGHFMSFLQDQDASIHLSCWLDLEQYRRTPQRDTALRRERSARNVTKYLNRNYFFGCHSPATIEQQNDILRLAGGLERLKLECVSNPVVVEVQDIVRTHIEQRWLPLFLSSAEFTERQKGQPKPQAAGRLPSDIYRRGRAGRDARKRKAGGSWMSSSADVALFRRVLREPVACSQFQHFVSLRGDFLENDVLFWLEVQRYKDLCHSHCDEATIQQKISTIIDCFIDSSMPPALQIDISPGEARNILDKRHELGPYIFREAQVSVFSELMKFWPEFQELSGSVHEEQLLPLLQEKQAQHRARVRRRRRREEEEEEEQLEEQRRRAQEELERPESSFRGEEEQTDEEEDESGEVQEGRRENKQPRAPSRAPQTPTQPLSWSYSKYMAALRREEGILRRHCQMEKSFSTASDSSSSDRSITTDGKHRSGPASAHSSRTEGRRWNR